MFHLLIPPAGVEVHGKFLMRKCDHLGSFVKICEFSGGSGEIIK